MTTRHASIRITLDGTPEWHGHWWVHIHASNGASVASAHYTTKANAIRAARSLLETIHDLSASVTVRGEDPIRVTD